jgi:hypothetical protein
MEGSYETAAGGMTCDLSVQYVIRHNGTCHPHATTEFAATLRIFMAETTPQQRIRGFSRQFERSQLHRIVYPVILFVFAIFSTSPDQDGPMQMTCGFTRAPWFYGALCVIAHLSLVTPVSAGTPILILRQPVPVQRAWVDIEHIFAENEKLSEPLPEPYIARGDLWSLAGGQEEALADYLTATELFFRAQPTPGEQAQHLARLRRALDAVVQQPRPHYPNEAVLEFGKGLTAFRSGDYELADTQFAEATRLMPGVALYRVHRALALRQLEKNEAAVRQVAVALSLIRATSGGARDEMVQINRGLEHVQGGLRLWLSQQLEVLAKPRVSAGIPPSAR